MRELLQSVARRAARYREDIQERRVSPSAEAVGALAGFVEPFPDGPAAAEDVVRMLDESGPRPPWARPGRGTSDS